MSLDMSQTTQLATSYTILQASTNGNAPSQVSNITIGYRWHALDRLPKWSDSSAIHDPAGNRR